MTDGSTIEVQRIHTSRMSLHSSEPGSAVLTLETPFETKHYLLRSDELVSLGEQLLGTAALLAKGATGKRH